MNKKFPLHSRSSLFNMQNNVHYKDNQQSVPKALKPFQNSIMLTQILKCFEKNYVENLNTEKQTNISYITQQNQLMKKIAQYKQKETNFNTNQILESEIVLAELDISNNHLHDFLMKNNDQLLEKIKSNEEKLELIVTKRQIKPSFEYVKKVLERLQKRNQALTNIKNKYKKSLQENQKKEKHMKIFKDKLIEDYMSIFVDEQKKLIVKSLIQSFLLPEVLGQNL